MLINILFVLPTLQLPAPPLPAESVLVLTNLRAALTPPPNYAFIEYLGSSWLQYFSQFAMFGSIAGLILVPHYVKNQTEITVAQIDKVTKKNERLWDVYNKEHGLVSVQKASVGADEARKTRVGNTIANMGTGPRGADGSVLVTGLNNDAILTKLKEPESKVIELQLPELKVTDLKEPALKIPEVQVKKLKEPELQVSEWNAPASDIKLNDAKKSKTVGQTVSSQKQNNEQITGHGLGKRSNVKYNAMLQKELSQMLLKLPADVNHTPINNMLQLLGFLSVGPFFEMVRDSDFLWHKHPKVDELINNNGQFVPKVAVESEPIVQI